MGLFDKLIEGEWPDADFLVVHPGQRVIATNDEKVIGTEPGQQRAPQRLSLHARSASPRLDLEQAGPGH